MASTAKNYGSVDARFSSFGISLEIIHPPIQLLLKYKELGIPEQIDYEKFYLYSIIMHSTAIEGSTVELLIVLAAKVMARTGGEYKSFRVSFDTSKGELVRNSMLAIVHSPLHYIASVNGR